MNVGKRVAFVLLVAGLAAGAAGCDKSSPEGHSSSATAGAAGPVKVAPEGTKFDPAITPDQVPEGAWYCNMNDHVHWAATTKTEDGRCPACGMNLTRKRSAK